MSREQLDRVSSTVRGYVAEYCGGREDDIRIQPITGDASTRQYFRALLSDGRSFVVAHYPEPFDPGTLNYCDVTHLFLAGGLPVPKLLDASGERGMILQEDLGDLRMQDWLTGRTEDQVETAYRQAIDLIIRIQQSTKLAATAGSVSSRLAFDKEKLEWELTFFLRHYLQGYLKSTWSRAKTALLEAEFAELAAELAALPRVLCHRDYHSRNLMVRGETLIIIDHQDARMGPDTYDIASLLEDPYADLQPGIAIRLRDFFVDRRRAAGLSTDSAAEPATFGLRYDLMSVQRLVKAIGTYAYQAAVMGNDVYVPYIPRARRRALAALSRLGRFPALADLMS
ncbi:MAG: phosphotransferase [Acidobacteria bacterium]|nr:phosphotransferase [Acidobacteriota bacterium]